jgi:hypothetical protein
LSDGQQQIGFDLFDDLVTELKPFLAAANRALAPVPNNQ